MSDISTVRILIGDPADGTGNPDVSDPDNLTPVFSDADIQTFLNFHGDTAGDYSAVFGAAADLCDAWAAKMINRSKQKSIGGTWTEDPRLIPKYWREKAKDFREKANSRPEVMFAEINYADSPFTEAAIIQRIIKNEEGE